MDLDAQLVDGGSCRSRQGYDDIAEGSQVTVRDAKGEIIAVGALQAGIQDGSEEYTARDFQLFDLAICSFAFSIEAPAGKGFYTISVGNANRGEHTYSEEELAEGVYLVLGE